MRRRGARDRGVTAVADGDGPGPGAALRPLAYGDLPGVLAIERRSFSTPWSLAMFVLELSKPSGICLAVLDEERLVPSPVCSPSAPLWPLMNVAVDPARRREGIATDLIDELFSRTRGGRITLE